MKLYKEILINSLIKEQNINSKKTANLLTQMNFNQLNFLKKKLVFTKNKQK
jgi:hypothetical protein